MTAIPLLVRQAGMSMDASAITASGVKEHATRILLKHLTQKAASLL
jgi:hypothetical protein